MRVVFLRASTPPIDRNTGPDPRPRRSASSASDPSACGEYRRASTPLPPTTAFAAEARDEILAPERAHDHHGVRCEDRSRFAAARDADRRNRRCDAPCGRRRGSSPSPSASQARWRRSRHGRDRDRSRGSRAAETSGRNRRCAARPCRQFHAARVRPGRHGGATRLAKEAAARSVRRVQHCLDAERRRAPR